MSIFFSGFAFRLHQLAEKSDQNLIFIKTLPGMKLAGWIKNVLKREGVRFLDPRRGPPASGTQASFKHNSISSTTYEFF